LGCATVSIFDKFRTPAWRPYRAAMFVAMGLSAVFPVLHGLQKYSVQEMQDRIGLSWLLLQGFLYILGAGLYAVSTANHPMCRQDSDSSRLDGRNVLLQVLLIYGEVHIRSSMCWLSWPPHHICMVYYWLLTTTMESSAPDAENVNYMIVQTSLE
jgi:predicted membrane channel-forming protein YqfA (hemolysin III family)